MNWEQRVRDEIVPAVQADPRALLQIMAILHRYQRKALEEEQAKAMAVAEARILTGEVQAQ